MARAPFQVLIYPYRQLDNGEFEYALLKRADKGYWQAVAGGGEDGENVIQAAQRETFEETGIKTDKGFIILQTIESVPVIEFADSFLWGEGTFVIPQYCFGVLAPSDEIKISHEHSRYEWFTFSEAYRRLNFTGNRTALWELDRRLHGAGPRAEPQLTQLKNDLQQLTFLKLGGSLITDKTRRHTAQKGVITRLADEIATALIKQPDLRLIIGHGSGSFGHVPAKKYGTRQGVHTPREWQGFQEVWYEASRLNCILTEALHAAGLHALAFPASAAVIAREGEIKEWDINPLTAAIEHNLLPVVYGDVTFDEILGGTILSTEDLFVHLAGWLQPRRILLAGLEDGVWEDYPQCTRLIPEITAQNFDQLSRSLGSSASTDVTGGMASKVRQALAMLELTPGAEAFIFSGVTPGNVQLALLGARLGTHLTR